VPFSSPARSFARRLVLVPTTCATTLGGVRSGLLGLGSARLGCSRASKRAGGCGTPPRSGLHEGRTSGGSSLSNVLDFVTADRAKKIRPALCRRRCCYHHKCCHVIAAVVVADMFCGSLKASVSSWRSRRAAPPGPLPSASTGYCLTHLLLFVLGSPTTRRQDGDRSLVGKNWCCCCWFCWWSFCWCWWCCRR
jgi:hypothetical protein